jgi:prepilin-type N-terminal cleavage/methylation domain-containing protein
MRRVRHAFTLVELLVVIGIIAVLISILLPALNRARQQAVSAQCMANLQNIGRAALLYAQDFKGWFPPSQMGDPASGNATDEKFLDYNDSNPDRFAVSQAMAKYAGYKVPQYPAPSGTTYKSPETPIFYCPADDQPSRITEPPWPTNNLLFHGHANGNDDGKLRYWWVANPWYWSGSTATINATYGGNVDLAAAVFFAHTDIDPEQKTSHGIGSPGPWFNAGIACKPGYDYLRRTKDKRASEVAICVDRSKQTAVTATNPGGWYMMHGGAAGQNNKKGWKNELFGDGHCEARRMDQLRERCIPAGPQAW